MSPHVTPPSPSPTASMANVQNKTAGAPLTRAYLTADPHGASSPSPFDREAEPVHGGPGEGGGGREALGGEPKNLQASIVKEDLLHNEGCHLYPGPQHPPTLAHSHTMMHTHKDTHTQTNKQRRFAACAPAHSTHTLAHSYIMILSLSHTHTH